VKSITAMLGVFLRGMLMGVADLVPGISGGTVAFMTGIYQRLINALSQFSLSLLATYKNDGVKAVVKQVDGVFLATLLSGILTSIILLAGVVTYLLENHALYVWGLFFGLVAGSTWFLLRSIDERGVKEFAALVIGAFLAWFIVHQTPVDIEPSFGYVVFCGAIAISAMVLPGISGSFILLLLGAYQVLLSAVNNGDMVPIVAFVIGAVIGLMTISRLLKELLKRFYSLTIALLTGFLVGSIQALWPWRLASEKGEPLTLVSPAQYETLLEQSANTVSVSLIMVIACMFVVIMTILSEKQVSKCD